jgi:hypothetical protein
MDIYFLPQTNDPPMVQFMKKVHIIVMRLNTNGSFPGAHSPPIILGQTTETFNLNKKQKCLIKNFPTIGISPNLVKQALFQTMIKICSNIFKPQGSKNTS